MIYGNVSYVWSHVGAPKIHLDRLPPSGTSIDLQNNWNEGKIFKDSMLLLIPSQLALPTIFLPECKFMLIQFQKGLLSLQIPHYYYKGVGQVEILSDYYYGHLRKGPQDISGNVI